MEVTTPLEILDEQIPLPVKCHVTVILDGEETHFDLAPEGKVIVDAANEAGADAPWSCHAGVCCTCKGKLLEGQVQMKSRFGLLDEEIEQGYILTCQSHPITPRVVVDYDV